MLIITFLFQQYLYLLNFFHSSWYFNDGCSRHKVAFSSTDSSTFKLTNGNFLQYVGDWGIAFVTHEKKRIILVQYFIDENQCPVMCFIYVLLGFYIKSFEFPCFDL